ncbi:sodium:calcium antiporter [Candidatus Micrarchaeota archaeon]|nr:sodium:calcium antiporter [Candidatus Micrarchaeota archaeon]
MLSVVYLLISTLVLAKSSETVIESTSKLSRFFGISEVTVGLVLVAVVTSLPELSVSVISASMGEGAISAGNVFGSNIANIFIAIGAGAFIYGSKIPKKNIGEIALVLLLTTVISAYIIFSSTVQGRALGLPGGLILLAVFAVYLVYLLKHKKETSKKANEKVKKKKAMKAFLVFVAGMIIVFVSSEFVVENAVITARQFGIAESVIGATIIAIGTSLPEISTSLQALRKKKYGIAVGNAVGSNMTNLTLVLGVTAVINEIYVNISVFVVALLFAIVANAILLYFAAIRKNMGRYSGILFILMYFLFVITILGLQAGI